MMSHFLRVALGQTPTQLREFLQAAVALVVMIMLPFAAVQAQTSEHQAVEDAWRAAWAASIPGPGTVKLLDQGTVKLGADYTFVPAAQSKRLMNAMGNGAGPSLLGLILPRGGEPSWFIAVTFKMIGYTPPDALARLKEQEIYNTMRASVAAGNEARTELEASKIDLGGYIEKPTYDRVANRMFMATRLIQSGPADAGEDSFNLDALIFGRDGIIELTLATHESEYKKVRRHMDMAYYGTDFVAGKKSFDAVAGYDVVVEYPLEMIFGHKTAEDIKAEKAAATARKEMREKRLRAEAAAAEAARQSWDFWMNVGLSALVVLGLGAGALFALGRRGGDSDNETEPGPPEPQPQISQAAIQRIARPQRTA